MEPGPDRPADPAPAGGDAGERGGEQNGPAHAGSAVDPDRAPLAGGGLAQRSHLGAPAVDAVFADRIAPGLLERADEEIPKYIEALRVVRRCPAAGAA